MSFLKQSLIAAIAALFVASTVVPGAAEPGPVLKAAAELVADTLDETKDPENGSILDNTLVALRALRSAVGPMSHSKALETAFRSYFAYKAEHPKQLKKPYLYFVDYGLPSTDARGYVFDMVQMKVVEGPFTVAHGRGSSESRFGTPTSFSNRSGSAATSLGLFLTEETYSFRGKSGGRRYGSLGLRLRGLSGSFNSNARRRGIVVHGAPYVTAARAGRSEGCPAMQQSRARRLLPMLANGALVFLFAPNEQWMEDDPWIVASVE